jgi:hypothetical protein
VIAEICCPTKLVSWLALIRSCPVRGFPESRMKVFSPEVDAWVLVYALGITTVWAIVTEAAAPHIVVRASVAPIFDLMRTSCT